VAPGFALAVWSGAAWLGGRAGDQNGAPQKPLCLLPRKRKSRRFQICSARMLENPQARRSYVRCAESPTLGSLALLVRNFYPFHSSLPLAHLEPFARAYALNSLRVDLITIPAKQSRYTPVLLTQFNNASLTEKLEFSDCRAGLIVCLFR
jgi:hypothetical protein